MKVYTSFEEIDRDLKILKLQQQIDKEQVKLNGNRYKSHPNLLLCLLQILLCALRFRRGLPRLRLRDTLFEE